MNLPSSNLPSRQEYLLFAIFIIFPMSLVMLWLAPAEGFKSDVGTFWAWAHRLNDLPISQFYAADYFCDYLPTYLYVLKAIGWVSSVTGVGHGDPNGVYLIKAPSILAHMAIVTLFFVFARRVYQPSRLDLLPLLASTFLVAFLPAQINNASGFGQVDASFNLVALGMILALLHRRIFLAAIIFGVLLCFKPHALFYLPLIGLFAIKDGWIRKPEMVVSSLALAMGTAVVLLAPFWWGRFEEAPVHFVKIFASYPYATLNSFNFYTLIGQNWRHLDAAGVFGLNPYAIFAVITVATTIYLGATLYAQHRRSTKVGELTNEEVLLAGCIYVMIIFLFAPKMHERYLMPIFPILILIFARCRAMIAVFVVLGVTLAISQDMVIDHYFGSKQDIKGPTVIFGCLLNFACLGIMFFRWLQLARDPAPGKNAFMEAGESEQTVAHDAQTRLKRAIDFLSRLPKSRPLNTRDIGWLLLAVAANAFIHFYKLGTSEIPQTAFTPPKTLVFNFQPASQVRNVWVYARTADGKISFLCEKTDAASEMELGVTSFYAWKKERLPSLCPGSPVSLTFSGLGDRSLAEVAFTDELGALIIPAEVCEDGECIAATEHPVTDETNSENFDTSYMTSTYFDEVYYARAAVELNEGKFPYESTHPPLGKILSALVVKVFGIGTLQWRFLGSLLGCLLPLSIFAMAWLVTANRSIAYTALFLATIESSKVTLARMYTIDVYVTFFLFPAYLFLFLFILRYCRALKDVQAFQVSWKTTWPLLASGVCLGLGLAVKWVSVFSAVAILGMMALLVAFEWVRRFLNKGEVHPPYQLALASIALLGILPAFLYWVGYWPYSVLITKGFSFSDFLANQTSMWSYHSGLKATHAFSSKFYSWPFVHLPVWLHSGEGSSDGLRRTIVMMGNPMIWWATIPAFGVIVYSKRLRSQTAFYLLLAGFLAQYVPWVIASRITFQYHYFPAAMFGTILIAVALELLDSEWLRWVRYAYLTACLVVFIMYWPALTGGEATRTYLDSLKWFPNWYF